jgi:hypothetical protein
MVFAFNMAQKQPQTQYLLLSTGLLKVKKKEILVTPNPRLSSFTRKRLKMKVDHLMFETVWIKGKENVEADTLSSHVPELHPR